MKIARIAAVALLLPFAAFAGGKNWCPNVKASKARLSEARAALERAPALYRGHRAKAIELIKQAEAEVEAAAAVNNCQL